jgi:hypothetical protein
LKAAASAKSPIALLVCDLVLPDGSGRTLHDGLLASLPGLRALFLSGYTDDEVRRAGLPAGASLVRKPLAGDELLARVRGMLDP